MTRRLHPLRLDLLACALLPATALVACGSDETSVTVAPAGSAPESPSLSTTTATPSPSLSAGIPCVAQGASGDALTAFGAGFTAWTTHHQVDPNRPDFFLPALNDGVDRYTYVLCTPAGRVIAYHLNFTPSITVAAAKHAFRSELPGDAILVYDTVQSGCDHIQYRSASLARGLAEGDPGGVADAAIILPDDPSQQAAVGTVFIDARVGLNETPATC